MDKGDALIMRPDAFRGAAPAGSSVLERDYRNQAGFTLIEIIAVLIILSVLSAIVVPRFIALDDNARIRALDCGVAELNGRESLTWANVKLSGSGWLNDANQVWPRIVTHLGTDYGWDSGPTPAGGTLRFAERSSPLNRNASTFLEPGVWAR